MSENNKKNKKEYEEYLKSVLLETKNEIKDIKETLDDFKNKDVYDLEYINIDINTLPLGMFYREGFKLKIRAAKVAEVQAYSAVNEKDFLDVTEKMNQLLSRCVKVFLPNGKQGSYKDIKDGDRLFLIFLIRELTFQSGSNLGKEVTCSHCGKEFTIPFRATPSKSTPKTFEFYEMPDKLKKFFNDELKCFEFRVNNATYRLAPPTIGIQESIYEDIKNKIRNDKNPNVTFL